MPALILTLVVLLGVGWLFTRVAFLATSLAVFTDSLAHASQWIGVTDPGVAWLLLGVIGGGIAGAFIGLQRAGRPVSRGLVRGTAAVVGGALLVAGSYPPSGIAAAAERAPRRLPRTAGVRVATPRPRVAARSERARSTEPETHTYATGGEVQLAPTEPSATRATPGAPDSAPALTPDSAPVPVARRSATVRPAGSVDLADTAARSIVADVRARLAEARDGAGTGDYAAALRALTAADESVALAAAAHGETAWVTALRRDVVSARGSVRVQCESSVALATRRGNPPPRCE